MCDRLEPNKYSYDLHSEDVDDSFDDLIEALLEGDFKTIQEQ